MDEVAVLNESSEKVKQVDSWRTCSIVDFLGLPDDGLAFAIRAMENRIKEVHNYGRKVESGFVYNLLCMINKCPEVKSSYGSIENFYDGLIDK